MAERKPQTYANHRRFVPAYHFVAFGIFFVLLLWALYRLFTAFSVGTVMDLLLVIAVGLFGLYARLFALAAQDRVIRLEERLRLERLLPEDLKARIADLGGGQLVALRFASDEEVVDLVRTVLAEGLRDRDAIKRRIRVWRPDYSRV